MKHIFVDTNIFIDLLADRRPFSKFAIELFDKAEKKKVRLYTSSHTIATTHYLLKRYVDEKDLREILHGLLEYLTIIAIDTDMIRKGLRSKHKDFEDALQIVAADSIHNIDCLVTRNLRDFKDAGMEVLAPDELVKLI